MRTSCWHFQTGCNSGMQLEQVPAGSPVCLDAACLRRAGRQLIYSLSQKHRNSLVLNYAIQRILQAGHEEEVANLGSSLASYFSVFHRLLTNRLKQVPQADAALLQSLAAELKVKPEST